MENVTTVTYMFLLNGDIIPNTDEQSTLFFCPSGEVEEKSGSWKTYMYIAVQFYVLLGRYWKPHLWCSKHMIYKTPYTLTTTLTLT